MKTAIPFGLFKLLNWIARPEKFCYLQKHSIHVREKIVKNFLAFGENILRIHIGIYQINKWE